jgi:hypothetical protein
VAILIKEGNKYDLRHYKNIWYGSKGRRFMLVQVLDKNTLEEI